MEYIWETQKQDFGAINFFTLKIGNDVVVKLQYIHAGKEDLAQGRKKKRKERESKSWLKLCMMPCLEIKEEKKKKKYSLFSPSKELRSNSMLSVKWGQAGMQSVLQGYK